MGKTTGNTNPTGLKTVAIEKKAVSAGILYLDEQMKEIIGGDVAAVIKNSKIFLVHNPNEDPRILLKSLDVFRAHLEVEVRALENIDKKKEEAKNGKKKTEAKK